MHYCSISVFSNRFHASDFQTAFDEHNAEALVHPALFNLFDLA